MKKLFFLLIVGMFSLNMMAQTIYYVKTNGDDSKDGKSWENAYATLSKAFTSSVSGDEIRVGQGTYTSIATYALSNKAITMKGSYNSSGIQDYSAKSIVDGNSLRLMTVTSTGSEIPFVIDGFVFKNGISTGYGGAISFSKIAATISNCEFINNKTANYGGGGVYFSSTTTACTVKNCKFYNNIAKDGGAIYSGSGFTLNVINSTIAYNTATNSSAGGGGGIYGAGTTYLFNSIVFANKKVTTPEQLRGTGIGVNIGTFYLNTNVIDGGKPSVNGTFNSVNNNDGIDANNADPAFIDGSTGNLHLQANSPAINKGDNSLIPSNITTDIENKNRILETIVDLGCYETLRYNITAGVNDESMGSINGTGYYLEGAAVSVAAISNDGYHFVNWTENGSEVSTSTTYNFNATATRSLVANFASNTILLSSGNTNASTLLNCSTCDVTVSGSGTNLLIDENKTLNSLTIKPGAQLTLSEGKTLNTTGSLVLQSDVTGNATFVDNNSLVFPTINATVQQYFSATDRNWYVSSPITSATDENLNTGSAVAYYDEEHGTWPYLNNEGMITMKGYISVAGTAGTGTINFSGTLNNGSKSIILSCKGSSKTGFNLVGNPYPSYLKWTENLANSANCLTTIWYRTKSGGAYSFQTYNASGDLGVPLSTSGYIPPMQAFWVRTSVDKSELIVNNSMRSHGNGTANLLKIKSELTFPQPIVRLLVSNGNNSDETVLYSNSGASNDFDSYDSPKMSNNSSAIPEIFTMIGSEHLVINGLNTIPELVEIPLGFTTGQSNSFSITATEFSNFKPGIKVYLIDKITGSEHDLTDGKAYNFRSDVTSSTSRFGLVFKSAQISTDVINTTENVIVSKNADNQITVNLTGNIGNSFVSVYNAMGQKLLKKQIISDYMVISNTLASGAYIVEVEKDGKYSVQRVILN